MKSKLIKYGLFFGLYALGQVAVGQTNDWYKAGSTASTPNFNAGWYDEPGHNATAYSQPIVRTVLVGNDGSVYIIGQVRREATVNSTWRDCDWYLAKYDSSGNFPVVSGTTLYPRTFDFEGGYYFRQGNDITSPDENFGDDTVGGAALDSNGDIIVVGTASLRPDYEGVLTVDQQPEIYRRAVAVRFDKTNLLPLGATGAVTWSPTPQSHLRLLSAGWTELVNKNPDLTAFDPARGSNAWGVTKGAGDTFYAIGSIMESDENIIAASFTSPAGLDGKLSQNVNAYGTSYGRISNSGSTDFGLFATVQGTALYVTGRSLDSSGNPRGIATVKWNLGGGTANYVTFTPAWPSSLATANLGAGSGPSGIVASSSDVYVSGTDNAGDSDNLSKVILHHWNASTGARNGGNWPIRRGTVGTQPSLTPENVPGGLALDANGIVWLGATVFRTSTDSLDVLLARYDASGVQQGTDGWYGTGNSVQDGLLAMALSSGASPTAYLMTASTGTNKRINLCTATATFPNPVAQWAPVQSVIPASRIVVDTSVEMYALGTCSLASTSNGNKFVWARCVIKPFSDWRTSAMSPVTGYPINPDQLEFGKVSVP